MHELLDDDVVTPISMAVGLRPRVVVRACHGAVGPASDERHVLEVGRHMERLCERLVRPLVEPMHVDDSEGVDGGHRAVRGAGTLEGQKRALRKTKVTQRGTFINVPYILD